MGGGSEPSGVGRNGMAGFSPNSARSTHPGPPPPHSPPFFSRSQKTWTSNSGYRIYSVSSLSLNLSAIRRDFQERQECRENGNRFAPMFLGTREGLFPTTFAKKSVRIYSCGREKERKMEGGGDNKSS